MSEGIGGVDRVEGKARELDWGASRRLDAELAMRMVMAKLEAEPFTGARLPKGTVVPEFDDPTKAGEYYAGALVQFLEGLGAEVVVMPTGTADADINVLKLDEFIKNAAPFETVVISGKVPGNVGAGGTRASGHVIEACAELLRVLLATALVEASEDCKLDEGLVVLMRTAPEFGGKVDIETGNLVGLARVRCVIYTSTEPRVSYLLGSAYGQAKPLRLVWEFPYVEHVYGPNRLRWRDIRAPDYEPEHPPAAVVPS